MGKLIRRVWRYVTAALTGKFNEVADPKVQVEQAIQEAQEQHRELTERAASVIANQKKAEIDLDRSMQDLEKLHSSTQQAVLMAEDAEKQGNQQRAGELAQTAEAFANQLVAKENQVETLKQMVLQATQASDQAKQAVNQNAMRLQERLAERQKLLSQIDQARMQEQVNTALASVSETIGQEVPSLEQVRDKIEARYAKAHGTAELQANSVQGRMLEVEQAAMHSQARSRLSQIREQLGMESGPDQQREALTEGDDVPATGTAGTRDAEPSRSDAE